jgi:hypothetical protein
MKHTLNWIAAAAAAASLACAANADADADATQAPTRTPEATAWQHHSAQFTYTGFTSAYTCDGMEGKVREIMRFLGARKDLQVSAHGCPRGADSLSHNVWVTLEFDTLAPAPAGAATADLVPAQWTEFRLTAQRPFFMGAGDCELIEAMKSMLTANFSLRSLDYSTTCTPHEVTFADFRIKGEVLKADPEHAG